MGAMDEVQELIDSLLQDTSLSKNVRGIIEDIAEDLRDEKKLDLKINSALQKAEDLSMNSNLSPYIRTQIWNLTTLLESTHK